MVSGHGRVNATLRQLSCSPSGNFCHLVMDPASLSHLAVLQFMKTKWSLDKKSFIFLLKPHLFANMSTGIHDEATGKGPVQMHKEEAERKNLIQTDSRLLSLDIFRHKSQHYPKGLVIWGASFLDLQLEIPLGLVLKTAVHS